ncbi:importin beta-like SAD2 homolog isoform X3 [Punica granatum]|uniref:Importin beta-like SAD2 homolog isoform X3 n=1 Tax=Punica granatum TaxID=22663 RepID=A0A6P8DV92_PUNGR|nr:importin beta-like SAD2 homolog isoform X3 [Punica granatum]
MEADHIARLLSDTLSFDADVVRAATESLDRLSPLPSFPYHLLSIATGNGERGQKVAAATYLKNFTRRNLDGENPQSNVSKEFKDQLLRALLQVEPEILKVLIEVFRITANSEYVKRDSWPELIPELRLAIQNSDQISNRTDCGWKTVNAVTVLQALIRPFQYFLNPKVAVEPVPPQLELIADEIIVPLLSVFHNILDKVKAARGTKGVDLEKILLLVCKCIYFAVRSHMPSCLAPHVASFCHDLFGILDSLSFDTVVSFGDEHSLRLKTAKRCLLIFCALITRHRKHSDKLMADMINCALKIVKHSSIVSRLDFQSERIISLAFDVISHVLETGPGWRLVSPHFSSLLDSAIFPTLVMNEKDISEWEEDADEYIRKNLPSDLEEISGWRDDLFSARKSATNLLGVISMSKGPPGGNSSSASSSLLKRKKGEKSKRTNQRSSMGELLVLPFLSKFPLPTAANASQLQVLNNYFGVLMAYGGLSDFLREQNPGFTPTLLRSRLLPLYTIPEQVPYLIASANWVLGELASCLPDEMSSDIYSSLLKALAMVDTADTTCYPVRVSAAGAISQLLENDYQPSEWMPLLNIVIGRIGYEDEESCILFKLLSSVVESGNENVTVHIPDIISSLVGAIVKYLPPNMEPWPQVVEQGFEALAVIVHSWESCVVEESGEGESNEKWASGQATIGRAFSALLQEAWLKPKQTSGQEIQISAPPSCIDDSSTLLKSIMLSVTGTNIITEFKVSELLSVWADLIADWHAWEESEDLSVFDCIKEAVSLYTKYGLPDFLTKRTPPPPAPPVPRGSIIEGIGAFITEAIAQYPSATWRASSCVHLLLHLPSYASELDVKQSLAISFSQAAFSHFREIRTRPSAMWRPLLLVISSCYLYYPDVVERILNKIEDGGFAVWASALSSLASSSFEPKLSRASELKLLVMALGKVVERFLEQGEPGNGLVNDCSNSLLEATVQLKEVQEGMEDEEDEDVDEEEDDNYSEDEDSDDEDDEDSEIDELEETQEEFLDRYARAAVDLENGLVVEEGDVEDQEYEPELGCLEEVDIQRAVFSLIARHRDVLIKGQFLMPLSAIRLLAGTTT